MPERSNGAVSKTVDPRKGVPGFESLSLRKCKMQGAKCKNLHLAFFVFDFTSFILHFCSNFDFTVIVGKFHLIKYKMNLETVIILSLIGLMAGIFGGIFGVGGAIIMIPALVYFLNVDQHTAQGTSLAVMLPPIGLFAAYNYYKAGQVNVWYAVIIAVTFMIGGYLGSKLALNLPENLMKKIFAIFLVLTALRMFFSGKPGVID